MKIIKNKHLVKKVSCIQMKVELSTEDVDEPSISKSNEETVQDVDGMGELASDNVCEPAVDLNIRSNLLHARPQVEPQMYCICSAKCNIYSDMISISNVTKVILFSKIMLSFERIS